MTTLPHPAPAPRRARLAVLWGGVALALLAAPAPAQQASAADLDRLMALIEAQQRQIDALRAEVGALRAAAPAAAAARPAPAASAPAATPFPAPAAADGASPRDDDTRTEAQIVEEGFVWRDQAGRSLTLSGQVNPAMNVVDDGLSTDTFIVDNDTSSSRLRADIEAPLGDTVLGATLELGLSPNNSYDVSQLSPDADAAYNVRRAEVTARSDRWGRIALGKGSSAADDTAEYDLSLVAGPIMYAGVADIAGGILFAAGQALTGTTVGDAFYDFDGDRLPRIRYDTPMWGPVQGSASWGNDDQWAAALTLGGDYGDWTGWEVGEVTVLAAAAVWNPAIDGVDYAYDGSVSVMHNPTGLSLTLSGGAFETETGDTPSNLYGKIGWDTAFWAIGPTGFGIDYTDGQNIYADGGDGTSIGFAAVQRIDRYGIDLYGQVRSYSLDSATGPDYRDITVATIGTKFTF